MNDETTEALLAAMRRCNDELAIIVAQPDDGTAKAYLCALGYEDWFHERGLIERELLAASDETPHVPPGSGTQPPAKLGGPRGCFRTPYVGAICGKCGVSPDTVHIPTQLAGFFCPGCCPICRPAEENR